MTGIGSCRPRSCRAESAPVAVIPGTWCIPDMPVHANLIDDGPEHFTERLGSW